MGFLDYITSKINPKVLEDAKTSNPFMAGVRGGFDIAKKAIDPFSTTKKRFIGGGVSGMFDKEYETPSTYGQAFKQAVPRIQKQFSTSVYNERGKEVLPFQVDPKTKKPMVKGGKLVEDTGFKQAGGYEKMGTFAGILSPGDLGGKVYKTVAESKVADDIFKTIKGSELYGAFKNTFKDKADDVLRATSKELEPISKPEEVSAFITKKLEEGTSVTNKVTEVDPKQAALERLKARVGEVAPVADDAAAQVPPNQAALERIKARAEGVTPASEQGVQSAQMAGREQIPDTALGAETPPISLETPQGAQQFASLVDDTTKLKQSKGINLDKLNISDEAKQFANKEYETIQPRIESVVGEKLTLKETQAYADRSAKLLEEVIGREATLKYNAALLKARERLAQGLESGVATPELIKDYIAVKGAATDAARTLGSFRIGADPKNVSQMQIILDAMSKQIELTDEIINSAKGVDFNDFKQASEFFRQHIKPTALEWLDVLRYNSMLSSPLTHMVNIFGNLVNSTMRAPLTKLVTGGVDLLSSKIFGTARQHFAGESGAYLKGYVQNFQKATKNFADAWKGVKAFTNKDFEHMMPLATGPKAKLVEKTLSVPMRLLEASDQFFTALSEGGERAALQLRQAKGGVVKNLEEEAAQQAQYGLFRQELKPEGQGMFLDSLDSLTSKIESLRRDKNPLTATIAKFTVPFIRTPMNIFKQGIEYSPLGFTTVIKSADKVEQLSKAMIGTGIGIAAGTLIASNRMTWAEPKDSKERDVWREQGMQPYSVKIGDRWYSYQKLPPFLSFPLSMVAAVDDTIKNKKLTESEGDLILSAIAKYSNFLADQSYFKSIGDFFGAVSGDELAAEKFIGNFPQQVIPARALGGWLARITDPLQRKIDNKADFIDKQVQLLMLNIPFVSQRLPARIGPISGEPIKSRSRVINAFSPVRNIEQTDEEAKKIETLGTMKKLREKAKFESDTIKEQAITMAAELKSMSPEEVRSTLIKTKESNPELFKKLKDVVEEDKLNLSFEEKQIKNLNVKPRAEYILNELNQMKTPAEKKAYLTELVKKKVVTKDVLKQIALLKKSQ